jgi:SpoVK/Ycf46/Vps4 family AAA+-type ATPase
MAKDIFIGNKRNEVVFQDVFTSIKNKDRMIISNIDGCHTLIDGMTIPKTGYSEMSGHPDDIATISAGITVYGELHIQDLILDFSLTDERSGERIYVDGGKLILDNVTIIGSEVTRSPVFINNGQIEMKNTTIRSKAHDSYDLEMINNCQGKISQSTMGCMVVNASELNMDNISLDKGLTIGKSSNVTVSNSKFNFYQSQSPRIVRVDDSNFKISNTEIIGENTDNPIRAFNSKLELDQVKLLDVRINGFGLELNTSKAVVKSSEIKGIFVKESELTVPDELIIYGFFEIFQASKLSIETLNVNIAPPKYAMKLHDNSRGQINHFLSNYRPLVYLDNSHLDITDTQLNNGGNITIEASGDYTIEAEGVEVRETLSTNETKKQTNDQQKEDKYAKGKALEELNNLVGLTEVKESVRKFINLARINKKKKEQGLPVRQSSLHSVYLGNPGTGKTTVARLVGQVLYEEGALSNASFVEVSRQDLVSGYLGKTTEQTQKKLEEAHGGVFFLDEAYTLNSQGGTTNYGQEALDTILKYMEDNRDDIMIIFAGYTKEMYDFFNMNPGLKSRIPHYFDFEDYSLDELAEIGIKELEGEHYKFDHDKYKKEIKRAYSKSADSSNARFVRNFNEKLILEQSNRIVEAELFDSEEFLSITDADWVNMLGNEDESDSHLSSLYEELNSLTGLGNVKDFISQLVKEAEANKLFEEKGMDIGTHTYHMTFTGPPGTGKTTVARLIARFLKALGVLAEDKLIEVDRSDLVGSYIGHTEKNTKNAIDRAMGGVLFIDEAYQLSLQGSDNDFGKQAIETLITALENYRDKFVVIFAGYTDDMNRFMSSNEGLRSRVPYTIEFKQYSAAEVADIVINNLKGKWRFNEDFLKMMVMSSYEMLEDTDKTSGRWARNYTQKLLMKHKNYIVNENVASEDFDFITDSTILAMTQEDMS